LVAEPTLCLRLRTETRDAHSELEAKLGLPQRIATLDEYIRCLVDFYRFYAPLEQALAEFPEWPMAGVRLRERERTPWLLDDLRALGLDPRELDWAPQAFLPRLGGFAEALGALYVLEGSTLGGRFILLHVEAALGDAISGAEAFFAGHRERTASLWKDLRTAIDAYGAAYPDQADAAVAGAVATFRAVGDWMLRER